MTRLLACFGVALALVVVACGEETPAGNGTESDISRVRDLGRGSDESSDGFVPDVGEDSTVGTDMIGFEIEEDESGPLPDLACFTDNDNDGHYAISCGGDDCDDNEWWRNPGQEEVCDNLDNNCNEALNDGITCQFYAHTASDLYLIDPFKMTAQRITSVPNGLWDIDTDANGDLWGLSDSNLYRLRPGSTSWEDVADLDPDWDDANGLAIDQSNQAFISAGSQLYSIDLTTGNSQLVGNFGGGWRSSGDLVINKDNSFFMSHRADNDSVSPDTLVQVDGEDAHATQVGVMTHNGVFGLTAAWGILFGVTKSGHLLRIDEITGQAQLLHTFQDFGEGLRFYGAASTPQR
ncbi:MAG: putative metal-binding motif-containing protein [Myxococcales bacterium]|nr:putative metal-binding motif-containing protein [Myxococcales bacterium]